MITKADLVVLILFVFPAAGFAQSHKEDLSGMMFVGLIKGGGEQGVPDTVRFIGCQFASQHLGESGFPKACYLMTETEGGIRFEVESVSKESGTARWKGRVLGEELEAIAVIKTPEGRAIEYQFQGRKVGAKGE